MIYSPSLKSWRGRMVRVTYSQRNKSAETTRTGEVLFIGPIKICLTAPRTGYSFKIRTDAIIRIEEVTS